MPSAEQRALWAPSHEPQAQILTLGRTVLQAGVAWVNSCSSVHYRGAKQKSA